MFVGVENKAKAIKEMFPEVEVKEIENLLKIYERNENTVIDILTQKKQQNEKKKIILLFL